MDLSEARLAPQGFEHSARQTEPERRRPVRIDSNIVHFLNSPRPAVVAAGLLLGKVLSPRA